MGDINDKLDYLETTKSLIKQAIEDKGVTVSDTDTFRSYATKIANIPSGGMDMINDAAAVVTDDYFDNLMAMITDQGGELTDSNRFYEVEFIYIPDNNCIKIKKSTDVNQSLTITASISSNDINRIGNVFAKEFSFLNNRGNTRCYLNGDFQNYDLSPTIIQPDAVFTVKYNLDNQKCFYVNDTKVADFSTYTPQLTDTVPMVIGAYISNDTTTSIADQQPVSIYSIIQVIDNNTHTYKPVYDMATGQCGLLDTYDNVFYGGFKGKIIT